MNEELVKQVDNKPLRDEKGQLLPGNTANPSGRPKGKTLKEYQAEKFRTMTDKEKEEWLEKERITGIDKWKMSEGLPSQNTDITSGGKPLYLPPELLNKNDLTSEPIKDSDRHS